MSIIGMFSKQILRSGFTKKQTPSLFGNARVKYSKIWEPDYLILGTTKIPEYDLINVQIKGYDFAVLEKFEKIIKSVAKHMNININNSWAAPQQDLVIQHYKMNSSDVQYEYNMKISERNIQILDVQSTIMAVFIETLLTLCPPGVNISFHEHEEYMEESRYIPNADIKTLEEQLDDLKKGKSSAKKNKF